MATPLTETRAEPSPLFERARETNKGFERIREVGRLDRISVVQVETDYWGGAMDGFSYGLSCLTELGAERGFSHFVVLDDCARRLGVAPNLGNDWQVVVGFVRGPDVDVRKEFAGYDLSKRDCRVWPPDPSESATPDFIGSDLWDAFTTIHFNWGGRAAEGPDDESGRPRLCEDR